MNIDDFKKEVKQLGIDIDDEKIKLLEKYYELLII